MALPSSDPDQLELNMNDASLNLLAALRKASLKSFKPLGFTHMEALVLVFIERGNTKPTDLSRLLGVVIPGVAAVTARMAGAGFLTKNAFEGDHRQVHLKLTDQGKRACQDIRSAWATHCPIDTTSFSEEEISAFIRVGHSLFP